MRHRAIALLSAAHVCDDLNQGALPALLPFFIAERHYTIAAAGGLILAANVTSSVLQPVLGLHADRRGAPWLVPAGLFLAGTGVALSGLAPTYFLVLLSAAVSGIGVAAFHPEAARQVASLSGERRGTAMGIFAVGGNIGFAIGPALATPLQIAFGLRGTTWLVLPAVTMGAVLIRTRQTTTQLSRAAAEPPTGADPDRWGSFWRVAAVAICRAFVFYGLNTFIPLYWIHVFAKSKAAGAAALTLMLSAGVAATLAGGWLADRIGRRRVVVWSLALLFPFLLAFLSTGSATVALALLVPIGVTLYAPFSVMTVMGQEYVPSRVATASGFIIGVAVTLGGLVAPVLGRIADLHGVHAALSTLLFVPLVGALIATTLPRDRAGISSGPRADS